MSKLSALAHYERVRKQTEHLCEPLETEDYCIQPMVDASPPKWHLAHTTWFFETFILKPAVSNYKPFHPAFEYLFNSYYEGVGARHPRPERGLLSRPLVSEVYAYRHQVDDAMRELLQHEIGQDMLKRIELGCHHEQQHQELLLTDLKFNLGHNPLRPIYDPKPAPLPDKSAAAIYMTAHSEHLAKIGAANTTTEFCFDNELPHHRHWLNGFRIADCLSTNDVYLEFIQDGGYDAPSLWLSEGWSEKNNRNWVAPEYWTQIDGEWFEYTLHDYQPVKLDAPVCHVSYYEADAFARWSGLRLATEFEWEAAALESKNDPGSFAESNYFHPQVQTPTLFGDCWQWTSSSYAPYPGYRPLEGTLGEYNGKFMANQYVLRGGSCATPLSHFRHSYRNFFYAKDRWQFTGIRLAKDS